jgi:hypothetical protein
MSEWIPLSEAPKGAVFETKDGCRAVKSEYRYPNGGHECVLLASGEYAHFAQHVKDPKGQALAHNATLVRPRDGKQAVPRGLIVENKDAHPAHHAAPRALAPQKQRAPRRFWSCKNTDRRGALYRIEQAADRTRSMPPTIRPVNRRSPALRAGSTAPCGSRLRRSAGA